MHNGTTASGHTGHKNNCNAEVLNVSYILELEAYHHSVYRPSSPMVSDSGGQSLVELYQRLKKW